MILETIKSEGLAHFSYLIGDDSAGIGAVIDPRRDVDLYLELAHQNNLHIACILETHIHADFVSGSRELAARTGATIGVGAEGEVDFEHRPLHDGDEIELGQFTLQVLHTPGHTPEHVCLLIRGGTAADQPWGLFSGDTLFAGEVGRPDLLGKGTEEKLARQLFDSLRNRLLTLPEDIILYPGHGEGSPCGASIGSRSTSTLGYEKRNNPILSVEDRDEFVRQVMATLTPAPEYYPRMKKINAAGPKVLGRLPHVKPMTADEFEQAIGAEDTVVVDTREIEAYGGAHIANALSIPVRSSFPIWAGRILQPEQQLFFVLPDQAKLDEVVRHLLRVGYENFGGYLRQGMRNWFEAGKPFRRTHQMSIQELKQRIESDSHALQVLDVRGDDEWEEGRIPTATHIHAPELTQHLDQLDRQRSVAVYCGSGYRASIAASLLERHGFTSVSNIPGSITAWKAAGYPLENGAL
jgi:hydroxyacylglutathione hydrolase